MPETPDHRTAVSPRSGDDHLIGDDGDLRNVEQDARDLAEAAAAAAPQRKARKANDPETAPA